MDSLIPDCTDVQRVPKSCSGTCGGKLYAVPLRGSRAKPMARSISMEQPVHAAHLLRVRPLFFYYTRLNGKRQEPEMCIRIMHAAADT